jgi:hypothetical protein
VLVKTEEMNKHLEVVEQHLTITLASNFDSFNKAFESFAGMKQDLRAIQFNIQAQKQMLMQVQQTQVRHLTRLGQLHQLRIKKQKMKDFVRQLLVLKQTVPIVQKLIASSGNFQVALDLIQNAQNVCASLDLDVAHTIQQQLNELQFECAKRLQTETIKVIKAWLDSLIVPSATPKPAAGAALFTKVELLLSWQFPPVASVSSPVPRLQQLIVAMLRTSEVDAFLRQLKVFAV